MIEVGDVVKLKNNYRDPSKGYRLGGRTFLVTKVLGNGDHVVLGMDFPKNQVFQTKDLEVMNV